MDTFFLSRKQLSTSVLALLAGVNADASSAAQQNCIICEHIALAASETEALDALAYTADATSHYCVTGGGGTTVDGSGAVTSQNGPPSSYDFDATSQYCVAQFFVYYAKDIAK